MVKVAVVILNWNGKNFLEKFIPALIRHSSVPGVELWVADNGSSDGSVSFLQQNFPQVQLITFDQNYGFAGGYNKALSQIEASYYVLLNSDVEVTENWISPVIEFMDNNPEVAACMPKLKSYDRRTEFEYAGAAGGFIDKFGYPFCRGRILNVIEKDEGQFDTTTEIFWASGACMFVRASLYKSAGGLDNDFFAHMEEIDLCWRMKNLGYKIMYFHAVTVYHVGGGTLPNNSPHKLYLNFRNSLLLLYKNLAPAQLHHIMFIRMILDGTAALKFLTGFSGSQFMAVFRAHVSFYRMKSDYRAQRKNLISQATVFHHRQIYHKSIIVDFFFRKRRKFNELDFFRDR
jgi:GT2 family glycosyltransferase